MTISYIVYGIYDPLQEALPVAGGNSAGKNKREKRCLTFIGTIDYISIYCIHTCKSVDYACAQRLFSMTHLATLMPESRVTPDAMLLALAS